MEAIRRVEIDLKLADSERKALPRRAAMPVFDASPILHSVVRIVKANPGGLRLRWFRIGGTYNARDRSRALPTAP